MALRSVAAADRRASSMPAPITGSTALNTFQKRSLRRKLQRFLKLDAPFAGALDKAALQR
jgi:hypothetical protein